MPEFTITVGNDTIGWDGYHVKADDMEDALMASQAMDELVGIVAHRWKASTPSGPILTGHG